MADSLVLNSLEIRRFRAFRQLQIDHLERVNLFVGKNNVGKSCLLEALWLYARRSPDTLWELLEARDEGNRPPLDGKTDISERLLAVKYLFHGRKDIRSNREPIQIGPVPSVSISEMPRWTGASQWMPKYTGASQNSSSQAGIPAFQGTFQGTRIQEPPLSSDTLYIRSTWRAEDDLEGMGFLGISLQMGKQPVGRLEVSPSSLNAIQIPFEFQAVPGVFIAPHGLDKSRLSLLWDNIALKPLQQDVLAALQLIVADVEDINLVGYPERIPKVRLAGINEPIPLGNLGAGMNRLFGIALALVNAKDGLVLIDEIESGLHYSVQPAVWRLIFEVARRLNVQVFAATHSRDCIEAFQAATQLDRSPEASLFSLREKQGKPGEVAAITFDDLELETVTREQIEVR